MESVTQLLQRVARAEHEAIDEVFERVYRELRRIARAQLAGERNDHTLTPTALVNEAYVKLVEHTPDSIENRKHFLAIAARAMRQVLVNHAERRATAKRGGGMDRVTFHEPISAGASPETAVARSEQVLALDRALAELERFDPRLARVVEYRFFAGLRQAEIASLLEISVPTVKRDWRTARAWLHTVLHGEDAE